MRPLLTACFVLWIAKSGGGRVIENGQNNKFNLNISRKPCEVEGRLGICMFNQECNRKKGQVLGTCLDGFIFGACCDFKEAEEGQDVEDQTEANKQTDPLGILLHIDKLLGSLNKSALILANGTLKDINGESEAVVENETTQTPLQTKIEVDHGNIENMMNSIFDNVIQQFDNKLPNLLNELSADPDEDEDAETAVTTTTAATTTSTAAATTPISAIVDEVTNQDAGDSGSNTNSDQEVGGSSSVTVSDDVSDQTQVTNNDIDSAVVTTVPSVVETKDSTITTTTSSESPVEITETTSTTTTTTPATTTTEVSSSPSLLVKDADTTTTTTTTTSGETSSTSTVSWDYRTDCGVRPIRGEGRIVGGTKSKFGDWPWQVLVKESTLLGLFTKNKCGGVLISNKHVLTAAHCQPGFLASLVVELGEYDVSGNNEIMSTRQAKVKRVVVHKDYVQPTFENDIAILELESDISREPHIVPICMPVSTDLPFEGKTAIVTGWGRLEYGGSVPTILQQVSVPIIDNQKCQEMFTISGHKKIVRESFLCAGYDDGKKDSCEGDSGGPLMMQREDKRWVLAGTVSHGIKCAYPNLPGIYMRMSHYKPWIEKVTQVSFDV